MIDCRWRRALAATTALVGVGAIAGAGHAQDLPTGGQVAAGAVAIHQSGAAMTVTQGSDRAIVNWSGFSIGPGNSVTFQQPGTTSAILNRVTGATPSSIAGQLSATGQVYLVNPNGIAITPTGVVNAGGGFVASTLGITNDDFLAGRLRFKGNGASAPVTNAGTITIGRGGYAALIGGTVRNDGLISVPLGKVGLGSGEEATLDLSGDGFLQVAVPTKEGAEGDGALVENAGTISADGGSVVIKAATAREAARRAVNIPGKVEARTVSGRSGRIVIGGGPGGKVSVSGKVRASTRRVVRRAPEPPTPTPHQPPKPNPGRGGDVTITGQTIVLTAAQIDVSGTDGGGTVRIGGDWQGGGDLMHAAATSVDAASVIRADALASGDGGTIVVWSDELTSFAGTISATGAGAGKGGNAEVSGKARLAYTGFADLSAPSGAYGTLLLDPYNVTISDDPDSNQTGFTATGDDSVINVGTLTTQLGSANVTVSTGASGSQDGDITVAAAVSWSAGTTLTLSAFGDIRIEAAITADTGKLALEYGQGAVASGNTAGYSVNAPITLSAGPNFSTKLGSDGTVTDFTVITSLGAEGSTTGTDLQGINGNLSGNYALGADIDASATASWNSGAGFEPIGTGTNNSYYYTGTFDGLGHTISGLSIDRSSSSYIGLFGYAGDEATLRNVGVLGGSVTGFQAVGGLVGFNDGSIVNVYATGSVTGKDYVGGLVGASSTTSTITDSYATGDVIGEDVVGGLVGWGLRGEITNAYATGNVTGQSSTGGLVGNSGGTITNAYATGNVTGKDYVGGLVGGGSGAISNAYATGSVTGGTYVGGLVGNSGGTITNAYATGSVTGGTYVGGLAGRNGGTITSSYWDVDTTGQSQGVGDDPSATGVTGLTTAEARTQASYTGFDFTNDWVMFDGTRPFLRAEHSTSVRNAHQLQLMAMDPAADYTLSADIDASETDGANAAGMWGSSGFDPIGTDAGTQFTGTFDGLGHTITGLTIDRPSSVYVGLFGYISGSSAIRNVGLLGGDVTGGQHVGGLVGRNYGTISNAYATGSVTGNDRFGAVGGLVGQNYRTISNAYVTGSVESDGRYSPVGGLVGRNYGTISNAYATGSVTSDDVESPVGGLVGFNDGTISNAYATGSVTGNGDDSSVGGLVGFNDSTISNAYATGSVTAHGDLTDVGGLVGINYGAISYAYATGSVTESDDPYSHGGLVGFNDDTDAITSSYWDIDTTGQSQGVGIDKNSADVTGLTTAEARTQASYTGFDFANDWVMFGDTRPFLRSEYSTTVRNAHQLQLMAMDLTADYTLSADIDASETSGANAAGMWGSAGFKTIGDFSIAFEGTFDGLGHTISGLTIDRLSTDYVGLFGLVGSGGAIRNIGLLGGSVTGHKNVGGLAGYNGGTISNAYATGSVTGDTGFGASGFGGLVGLNNGRITNAYATGSVTGGGAVGGLVGLSNATITNTYATGSVTGTSYVGGLVGETGSGAIVASFWNTETSGQSQGVGSGSSSGVTGLDTAGMATLSNFTDAGWDIDGDGGTGTTWRIYEGQTAPLLRSFLTTLTVTGGAGTKTYDGSATSSDVGTLTYDPTSYDAAEVLGTAQYTASSKNAGIYSGSSLSLGGLYSTQAGYDLILNSGTLTVTKATLTASLTGTVEKVYDGTTTATLVGANYDLAGIVGTDNVTLYEPTSGTYDTANAGTGKTVSVSRLALLGSGRGNYKLASTDVSGDVGTITAKTLTASLTGTVEKVYDGTTAATLAGTNYDLAGIVGTDNVVLNDPTSGLYDTAHAGTGKTVSVSGLTLSGSASDNYKLASTDASGDVGTITKAALTVTAKADSKTYDGLAYSGGNGVTYSGFVNGETSSVLGGTLDYTGTSQGAVDAGSYVITPEGYTSDNYSLDYQNGTLTVDPKTLTASLQGTVAKVYDGTTAATLAGSNYDLAGIVGTDDVALNDPTSGTYDTANAGTGKTVSVTGLALSGTAAGNYQLSGTDVSGNVGLITKAALTVTAKADSKTYDGLAYSGGNGVTYSGFVNGETSSVLGGTLDYTGTSQGAVDAGSYVITPEGYTSGNYAIAYDNGALTVDPRTLTASLQGTVEKV